MYVFAPYRSYSVISLYLNKIKTKKYKYPNKVHKVPVQTSFFNHQVMTTFVKYPLHCHNQHNDIYNNS